MVNDGKNTAGSDRDILRGLAERKLAISQTPENHERRRAWLAHDGAGTRTMILAEHLGVRDARQAVPENSLECLGEWERGVEKGLRSDIYRFEKIADDHVVEPFMNLGWRIDTGDFGVKVVKHHGGDEGQMGSYSWEPPIRDLRADLSKLRPRLFSVNREASMADADKMESVFGGLLPVRMRWMPHWTLGMTATAISLVGLENFMMAMYDTPEELHALMRFLCDDLLSFTGWLESEGLYTLNNGNDYIGSGSEGHSAELPAPDYRPGSPPRRRGLWTLLESQETVGVGPGQFEEFVFPYQLELAEKFGRIYYGCCEPIDKRWHVVERLPGLARVSVSPWSDVGEMAAKLGRNQ